MQDGVKRKPLRHLFVCRVSSLKLPAAVANIVPVSSLVADVLLSSSPAVAYVPAFVSSPSSRRAAVSRHSRLAPPTAIVFLAHFLCLSSLIPLPFSLSPSPQL